MKNFDVVRFRVFGGRDLALSKDGFDTQALKEHNAKNVATLKNHLAKLKNSSTPSPFKCFLEDGATFWTEKPAFSFVEKLRDKKEREAITT